MRRKRRSPAFAREEPENAALHLGNEELKIVILVANMVNDDDYDYNGDDVDYHDSNNYEFFLHLGGESTTTAST